MAEPTNRELRAALKTQLEAVTGIVDRRLADQSEELKAYIDSRLVQQTESLRDHAEAQVDRIARIVRGQFEEQDKRFDLIEAQLKDLDVPARLRAIEVRLDRLENRKAAA